MEITNKESNIQVLCPHDKSELQSVPIVKYNNKKVFGRNFFCPKQDCNFEMDVKE